jgi:hypothetical protein
MRNAPDRGFLWRVEKDARVSYLFGTVHVAKFDWMFPGPVVHRALMASDTVALELDMLDPQIQRRLAEAMTKADAVPLSDDVGARLERQAQAACVDGAALARLNPLLQVMTLSVLAARHEGLDPQYGIDAFLSGFARAAGKSVVSLETPEGQMQSLLEGDAAQTQALLLQGLADLEAQRLAPRLMRIAQVWADSDHAQLASYALWCECLETAADKAFLKRLLDARNPAIAERIDQLHASSRGVFAATGSLHMIGPASLPTLLRERGFHVERIELQRRD